MANIVTVSEALTEALDKANVTKYRLAKSLGVEPITIDKWLTGAYKTMRRDVATILDAEFGVKVDDLFINLRQTKMKVNDKNELEV